MRRPSSNHQRGVSRVASTPPLARKASLRRRFEAATALCAMVSTLSELECIQPQLGTERPPQLPGAIRAASHVVVDECIHRRLRKQAPASPRGVAQKLQRGMATPVAKPVADRRGTALLVPPPDDAVREESIDRAPP